MGEQLCSRHPSRLSEFVHGCNYEILELMLRRNRNLFLKAVPTFVAWTELWVLQECAKTQSHRSPQDCANITQESRFVV